MIPLAAGIFYALSFPGKERIHFFPLIFLSMALLFSRLSLFSPKKTFTNDLVVILFFSFGYNLTGYYWIPYTIEEFGGIGFPLNYILAATFTLIITPQYLALISFHAVLKRFIFRPHFYEMPPFRINLIFALAATLFEYYIPQQFPAHVGHPWLKLAPNLGLAPYLGAIGFSFFTYWFSFSIVTLLRKGQKDIYAWCCFILFLSLNLFYPLKSQTQKDQLHSINIRMVQPNIGNFMKIDAQEGGVQSLQEVYSRYKHLTNKESQIALDLIIWPETSFPDNVVSKMVFPNPANLPSSLVNILETTNTPLFFGGYDLSIKNNRFGDTYNAAYLLSNDLKLVSVYHKIKLIPFGEGLPFESEFLRNQISNISYFAQGEKYTLFKIPKASFISTICYEILFPEFNRDYLNSLDEIPDFMINLTNDSWYGDSSEPHQHLFLAKWRALEFDIPIIRSTNTGISTVIYPNGLETDRLGVMQMDTIDLQVILAKRKATIYQIWGILPLLLLWPILFLPTLFFGKRKVSHFNSSLHSF